MATSPLLEITEEKTKGTILKLSYFGLVLGGGWWLIASIVYPDTSTRLVNGPLALLLAAFVLAMAHILPSKISATFYTFHTTIVACATVLISGYATVAPGLIFPAVLATLSLLACERAWWIAATQAALFVACTLIFAADPFKFTTADQLLVLINRPSQAWLNALTITYIMASIGLLSRHIDTQLRKWLTENEVKLASKQATVDIELEHVGNLYRYIKRNLIVLNHQEQIVAISLQLLTKLEVTESDIIGTPIKRWFRKISIKKTDPLCERFSAKYGPNPDLGTIAFTRIGDSENTETDALVYELLFLNALPLNVDPAKSRHLITGRLSGMKAFADSIDQSLKTLEPCHYLIISLQNAAQSISKLSEVHVQELQQIGAARLHGEFGGATFIVNACDIVIMLPALTTSEASIQARALNIVNRQTDLPSNSRLLDWKATIVCAPLDGHTPRALLSPDLIINEATRNQRLRVLEHIKEQQFTMHFQPLFDLQDLKSVRCLEGLARWVGEHPLPPPEFLKIAEDLGLSHHITLELFKVFCQAADQIIEKAGRSPNLFSFNLDAINFMTPTVQQELIKILKSHKIKPQNILLEIVETHSIDNYASLNASVSLFQDIGIKVAIDDFGKSFSSLDKLAQIKADVIKLDARLIDKSAQHDIQVIAKHLITLAHSFGADIVAEGIETQLQLRQMQSLGADWGQGYLLGAPADSAGFIQKEANRAQ